MSIKKVLAVSSGKGGVGKSTLSVELACAFSKKGFKVGLLDADLTGPNVPLMMGAMDDPKIQTSLDGAGKEIDLLVPPVAHGVKVISMGLLARSDEAMIWRGPMLHNALRQFLTQVAWGELDFLVVDMPPGTGDVQLSVANLVKIDGAVLVTTPSEVSTLDVRKAHAMFNKIEVPVLGLIENMSYFVCDGCDKRHFIFGEEGGQDLAQKLQTPLLAQIPLVQKQRQQSELGMPLTISSENALISKAYLELADRIAAKMG